MKVAIVDGYVDEPSCLGVPPYISPYPRYIKGMLNYLQIPSKYFTADQVRENPSILEKFDFSIVIAGAIVPGKYLSSKPLSLEEINLLPGEKIVVGGLALELEDREIELLNVIDYPFEEKLLRKLKKEVNFWNNFEKFVILGSEVVKEHPEYPHLICEIETYRGCYWGKCSFCMERLHKVRQRSAKCVLKEIEVLYNHGIRHFRLGRQTDFLTYMADFSREVPKPNPEKMLSFHKAIWKNCPEIKTLHLDNINPKTIAEYPMESEKLVKIIVEYQTPGNVAAMGLESADKKVIKENNLCSDVDDVEFAIELINKYGSIRGHNGMPAFLPGLNFVIGLRGETKRTFEKNYEFLNKLLEKNLLLRRINIRQVKVLRYTPLFSEKREVEKRLKKHRKYFLTFKKLVRENIDRKMLEKILPIGTTLKDVRCEVYEKGITFGRQFGSYPLIVGIIGKFEKNTYLDVKVTGYGMRSVTAIKPIDLEKADLKELEAIPGIGKKIARKILMERNKGKKKDELLKILKRECGESFKLVNSFLA